MAQEPYFDLAVKSHCDFWLTVYLVCPWSLLLVPGCGLCTDTLWDGAHWGGLSLGSAQLLVQSPPVLLLPDCTSWKNGFRASPLILIYGIVCGPFV